METKLHGTHSGARIASAGDTARQFVLERIPDWMRRLPNFVDRSDLLPMAIWVNPESIESEFYACPNCEEIYLVIPEAVHEFRRVTKINSGMNSYVCLCEGHFIE